MLNASARVAITGANGLVGRALVKHLVEQGYAVTAILRSQDKAAIFCELTNTGGGDKLQVRIADVSDLNALSIAFAGADAVVHAAANVNAYGLRQEIYDTNCGGTHNAIAAAKANKIKHFIYVSSLSTITGQGDQFAVAEDAPLRYCGEAYADSKIDAEKLVMQEAARSDINVTIIRPGFIYGPYERAWMPRLIQSITEGKAALIDGGKKETNVVYIENLCRAINAAILLPRAYGQVYNITDGMKVSKKELFDAIADGLGLPRVKKQIPGFIAQPFCELVSLIAPLLPMERQKKLARFSRAAYRLVGVNQGFSISKAEHDLNYVDRIPFAQGMKETLRHFSRSKNTNGERWQ